MGQALLKELADAGYTDVHAPGRADADLLDFSQTRALFAALQPEMVFHLAARVSGIMGNMRGQGLSFLENTLINTHVVEAARMSGVRKVVAMGTAAVYSDLVPLPMREDDLWLGAPHGSEAAYAHAKRAMLAQLEAYRDQYGMAFAYCIATNMYGPHDRFDECNGHVVPSLLSKFERAARTGGSVEIWGSGKPQRDFLYAGDAASALRLAGEQVEGSINLASGRTHSIAELVAAVVEVTGFTGDVVWDRTKPDGQLRRAYDTSRLTGLGWAPSHTLQQGLAATYQWLARHVADARR